MEAREGTPAAGGAVGRWAYGKQALLALTVVGLWIPLGCTLPQIIGPRLWRALGVESALPLTHLITVALNAAAVLVLVLVLGKRRLLAWQRPAQPAVFLMFLPLMFVNVVRGPFTSEGGAYIAVVLLTAICIGFWEEFLFRGLIQARLAVLGPRVAVVIATVFFAVVHLNLGLWQASFVVFPIGLALGVARDRIGMWPLVCIHATIDFVHDLFDRTWDGYLTVLRILMALTFVIAVVGLIRLRPKPD